MLWRGYRGYTMLLSTGSTLRWRQIPLPPPSFLYDSSAIVYQKFRIFFETFWYTDCYWVPSIVRTAQKAALFYHVVCRVVSVWSWIAHRDIHMTCTIAYHVCDIKFLWSCASIGFIFLFPFACLLIFHNGGHQQLNVITGPWFCTNKIRRIR